jgi:hypothetical protein
LLRNSGEGKVADQVAEPFIRKISRVAYRQYQSKIQTQGSVSVEEIKKVQLSSHDTQRLPQPPPARHGSIPALHLSPFFIEL